MKAGCRERYIHSSLSWEVHSCYISNADIDSALTEILRMIDEVIRTTFSAQLEWQEPINILIITTGSIITITHCILIDITTLGSQVHVRVHCEYPVCNIINYQSGNNNGHENNDWMSISFTKIITGAREYVS